MDILYRSEVVLSHALELYKIAFWNVINRIPVVAGALVAPTLIYSTCAFLKSLSTNGNFNLACQDGLTGMKTMNFSTLIATIGAANNPGNRLFLPPDDLKKINAQAILCGTVMLHLLFSSTFTYLALRSNPLYAVPAVVAVLPLLKDSYLDGLNSAAQAQASSFV